MNYDYGWAKRKIAEIEAACPIPVERTYPIDRETADRQEADVVRKWLRTGGVEKSAPAPAAASVETICNLIAEVVSPIVADLSRQLAESGKRARLNELRCTALEERCVNAERRIAAVETRSFADPGDRSLAPRSRTH